MIPDVWINLGHMYLYTKQPLLAIDLYTKCMNEFFDGQGSCTACHWAVEATETACKSAPVQTIDWKA